MNETSNTGNWKKSKMRWKNGAPKQLKLIYGKALLRLAVS